MSELLCDHFYEEANGAMERMAAAPNPCIYLEAMEEAENQTEESE